MARQLPQDSSGFPNTRRPPPGATYRQDFQGRVVNPYTGNRTGQESRYPQGDIRSGRPRLGRDARGRVGTFGSANPYQNSTNQGTYTWLGTGFPHPLPIVPPQIDPPPSFAPIQPGGARPSWDLAGIAALLGPYYHIPIREDYNLNWKLREAVPLIDAAILRLKDLVGFPEIEANPRLKNLIDTFLRDLPVNRVQVGAQTWARTHLDNAYTYGRAHTEILLTRDLRGVFGLVDVHPTTCAFRPTFDAYVCNVVQYQFGGGVPITLIPELLLTSVHDFRGDDPNGTSLIASLPFVAEILIKTWRAHGQLHERFGCPNYHVNWEPPDDWNDPTGAQTQAILAPMQQNLHASDVDRAAGRIRHFWTTGKITVDVMGAMSEQLQFQESAKVFAEQVMAKTGIPPFMMGLSWSTTERMSTAQAKLLTEVIQAGRRMLEPVLRQLISLHLRLLGRGGNFELRWPEVSMIDLIDTSRAAWMDAQAESIKLENLQQMGRLGIYSMPEIAQQLRPDLEKLKPDEILERLNGENGAPKLVDKVPEPTPVQVAGMRAGNDAMPGGNNPRDESVKEFARHGNGGGNGKH